MEYQQAAAASTTFSRKLSTSRGLPGKHAYDGVYGGPPKLGTRGEDYREIFGGSGSCSIPILDVPELSEGKASVDARSSMVDYSKIFGGFGDADYAVPFEELQAKRKKEKNSSQEFRLPAEARIRPVPSQHSNIPEEKVVPSPEGSFQSFHGVKQFNMSYNKTNPGSKNGTNGMTKIAQLHAVPGYTCLIDESMPPKMAQDGKPVRVVLNEAQLNNRIDEVRNEDRPRRKTVSGPQARVTAEDIGRSHSGLKKKSSRNMSISNDMSFDGFGFGLCSNPSTPPSNKGTSSRPMNSLFGVSRSEVSQGNAGNHSPPFFDEEVDVNSVAAASADAVRKAIEEAQAKIKIAKELMQRKKEGLQCRVKLSSKKGLKTEKEVKCPEKARTYADKEAQEISEKESTQKNVSGSLPECIAVRASEVVLNLRCEKESSIAEIATREIHNEEFKSTRADNLMEEEAKYREATMEFPEPAGTGEVRTTTLEFKQAESGAKFEPSVKEYATRKTMIVEENFKKSNECGTELKVTEEALEKENVEGELNSVKWPGEENAYTDDINTAHEFDHVGEHKEEMEVFSEHIDQTDKASGCSSKIEKYESELEMLQEPKQREFKDMKELNGMHQWTQIGDIQREAQLRVEVENILDETLLKEESNFRPDDIHEQNENEKGHSEPWETVEYEKKRKESWDTGKSGEVCAQAVIFSELQDRDETTSRLNEDVLVEGNKKLKEAKVDEKLLAQNYEVSESEKNGVKNCERIVNEVRSEICRTVEDDKNLRGTPVFRFQLGNLEATDDVYMQEENKNIGMPDKACGDAALYEGVEGTTVLTTGGNTTTGAPKVSFEPKEVGIESEAVEKAHNLEEVENFNAAGLDQVGIKQETLDTTEALVIDESFVQTGETFMKFENKQTECVSDKQSFSDQEKHVEEVTYSLQENDRDVNESEVSSDNEQKETNSVFSDNEKWSGESTESKTSNDLEEHADEVSSETGKDNRVVTECEPATSDEEYEKNSFESSSGEEKFVDHWTDIEVSQQSSMHDGIEATAEISPQETTNQLADKKEEKYHKSEEGEPEDTLQREVEVENKSQRKKDEAKERALEKERERIVVERAIREVRERAFAEARERAATERAAAESRQRSEKASADNKSAVDKAFMEAKLKAERAAVERAPTEARVRALERALSEKATSNARNQAEKLAGDKFASASRDGVKSTDQLYKGTGPGPSSNSRYSSSSNHGVPHSTNRTSQANGESAQRCKAKSERHQRTTERAAKALAEKNMRDLLAQKEQAERNRLAETLDAEVKRWSSGKERNLRALLSTLQYILGPESGWKPIPLTDLIPTTSVKKAYRKATLFVHPDKLQQRGATIQQKYTCEKVFDLLKEAWNKFSAEER